MERGFTDSRDFLVSAKMQRPDKNIRPVEFFEAAAFISAHRAGILPHFRNETHRPTFCGIFVEFFLPSCDKKSKGKEKGLGGPFIILGFYHLQPDAGPNPKTPPHHPSF
jgi:hypothetical protein